MTQRSLSRRTFLRQAGGVVVGLALAPLAACDTNTVTPRASGGTVPFLSPPTIAPSQGGFYVQNGAEGVVGGWSMPDLDPSAWTLTIDGLVASPLTLRLNDLEAEAASALTVLKTMRCVTDTNEFPGLTGTTLWRGIPLRLFLDRAGLDRNVTRRLRLYGTDGFTNNIPLDAVYRDFGPGEFEPLLVTHMEGVPLTREHGRPVRLVVQDSYGYKNVKWLSRIQATASDTAFGTYQQILGYADEGVMQVASKITNPVFNEVLPAGTVLVSGFAVSGQGAITDIDIAFDGGPFHPARIVPIDELQNQEPTLAEARQVLDGLAYPFPSVWVLWTARWDATPGSHQIRVRATDSAGHTQPDTDRDPTDGSNPIPAITVTVM